MNLRDRRKRLHRKQRNRPLTELPLNQRLTRVSLGRGMHVGYSLAMPTGRIDRAAWAEEVGELIGRFDPGSRSPGNKSAFARRIGLTTRSVDRWLAQEVDVSLDSVRAVADALDISQDEQVELLSRIGYFSPMGRSPGSSAAPDPRQDPVIQEILADPNLSDDDREELVRMQVERIEQDLARRRADFEMLRRRLRQDPEAS